MPDYSQLLTRLRQPNPDLSQKPTDKIPGKQVTPDVGDIKYLQECLLKSLRSCIYQRETYGFNEKRLYDVKAYYGIKDEFLMNWPWPRASAFPEPITPTLVDTGKTNIQNALFRNPLKTMLCTGVGPEDKPLAPKVVSVMNWQVGMESNMYSVQDANAFRVLLHGTGWVKTWIDIGDEFKLNNASVPIENIYVPIKSSGCQRGQTEFIHEFIPMTYNDMQFRMGLKIGSKPVYDKLDLILPGFKISESLTFEEMQMLQSQVTGLDVQQADQNDLYYMVETHCTFYPKGQYKAKELLIHWSPKGGTIHRIIENIDLVRPYAKYYVYPQPGFAYHQSLPDKIRHIQEKANYTEKQVTDAADKAIMNVGFIEEGNAFNANDSVRVPSGMYEIKKGTSIQWEPTNISAIMERGRQMDRYWELAQRLTAFNELFQGRQLETNKTLGEAQMVMNKADARFATILNIYGLGWKETCDLIYFYDDRYIPREKVVKILGATEYYSVDQIFPQEKSSQFGLNLNSKFNFSMAGKSQIDQDVEDKNTVIFCDQIVASVFGQDKCIAWRAMKEKADTVNFHFFDNIVPKPPEADNIGFEEVIEKIMSGEYNVSPSPLADPEYQD